MKIPAHLEEAFKSGFVFEDAKFETVEIGTLHLQDGVIIAMDPLASSSDTPFNTQFPKGSFKVELARAIYDNDQRNAFARIKFSDETPVKWEMALKDGQDASTLADDEIFGYSVDAGLGCFIDTACYAEHRDYFYDEMKFYNDVEAELAKNKYFMMWERNGKNVAVFTSGYGDGFYASYIGFDSQNRICRLVTDFGLTEVEAD